MADWLELLNESLFGDESEVLHELQNNFDGAMDEITDIVKDLSEQIDQLDIALQDDNIDDALRDTLLSMKQSKIYQKQYQETALSQVGASLDKLQSDNYNTIKSYLNQCYTDGWTSAFYEAMQAGIPLFAPINQNAVLRATLTNSKIKDGLYKALGVDTDKLRKTITQAISRGIARGASYRDIAEQIKAQSGIPLRRADLIARTDGHRVFSEARDDAQHKAKAMGCDLVRIWTSTLDGRTRTTHRKLDGQIREMDEPFEMDGYKVMFPSQFGDPSQDCNCRCVCISKPRWAMDEDELQALKDRADYYGLDKSNDFKNYQKKFLKYSEED